jgi:hypothetical protein
MTNARSTLDSFLPPSVVKPKKDTGIYVEEKCSNPRCCKKIPFAEPKYTLRVKGKENVYCQACAKTILRPQENTASV